MFEAVASKLKSAELEEKILALWRQKNIFKKSVELRKENKRFTLYEGPPTANGSPGIHHVLSRCFKDVIPRFKAMKGYYTPRIAGWDTHGLPVELEVEKELGLATKADIEKYGIAEFNKKCRESVFKYKKEWDELTERIAFWLDLEHPYITMDNTYIESVWWAIKQMWDKGLIYKGYKTAAHCPRCGTSLSSHEVALGYKENTEDPSVYIKFKVVPSPLSESERQKRLYELSREKPTYFLAWTTTPWTLAGNTALAVAADAEYVVVEVGDENLIIGSARIDSLGLGDCEILERLKGSDLATITGVNYEPLYNPHRFNEKRLRFKGDGSSLLEEQPSDDKLTYRVIATDFVSMEDGTGIVHVAPSFGEVDFEAGKEQGLDFVQNVDLSGMVTGDYPFAGRFVKDADPLVIDNLEKRGLLFKSGVIKHTYPFCWRCDTPVLYYVKRTWYIKTTAVKERLISGNEEINWYPEHIKKGRFGDWLENNVDWAFSRERYWGTPLPVWQCPKCGKYECIGGLDELKSKDGFSGLPEPLDLHRPYVDEITFDCQCGGKMERAKEVIDCWFDSGAMPFAQWHYPFEDKDMLTDGRFPADYISEAVDQTRGWFYSLHAISTLLFGKPCFENVICLGHILDEKGDKMSKAKKNVIEPWKVINDYGADAVRWYLYTTTAPGNARRFSENLVSEISKKFINTLWNTYSFFVMYANIDSYNPEEDKGETEFSELDNWITSELNQLVSEVDSNLENYNPTDAGRRIEDFVSYLSNWYVRRSRRRFWKSENDADKLAAYRTLYNCLVTLSKLLAPFMPFMAEALYQNLVLSVSKEATESVHLTDFPVAAESKIDERLSKATRLAMKLSSLGRAARSSAGIKVRQPLQRAVAVVSTRSERELIKGVESQIIEELNIKELRVDADTGDLDDEKYSIVEEGGYAIAIFKEVNEELAREGMAREIVHRIQNMRRSAGFEIADYITTFYQGDEYLDEVIGRYGDYIEKETLSKRIEKGVLEKADLTEKFKLTGHEIGLSVKR